MSDSDEDNYCMYGRLLEPYDEDEIPSKKPINIEDQIATDAHGRRRFHGAFTGGFSAGFCNTVGSLEGWKPKDFKSSRQEKAEKQTQRPEDFMDEEDVAEFGFAPQGLRTTDDYNSIAAPRKRRFRQPDGPIPGQPVLQLLLEPAKETIGVKLLKRLGWRPGQGVGPRLTKAEKKRVQKRMIGCEMPPGFERKEYTGSESDSESDTEITFAPDDYQPYICQPKENTCGMGYSGLNKNSILSGFSASKEPSHFSMVDRNNKVLSIQGQAFGVGAFEEDDEDIYSKDDMTKYDFELGDASTSKNKKAICSSDPFQNFIKSTVPTLIMKIYPPPELPKNFIPKHGARISRFEPLPPEKLRQIQQEKPDGPNRHSLTAEDRSKLLENSKTIQEKPTQGPKTLKILGGGNAVSSDSLNFKPFAANPEKQTRYEQYLELMKTNDKEKIAKLHPISMTEWECEQERAEFEQAAKMYKPRPTDFLVFNRFVAAQQVEDVNNPLASVETTRYLHGSADMREAAKRKMFGKLTRNVNIWNPTSLLCKRFNIPEPYNTSAPSETSKKKKNYSVFDYLNALDSNTTNRQQSKVIEKLKDKKTEEKQVVKDVDIEDKKHKNNDATETPVKDAEILNTIPSKSQPVEPQKKNIIPLPSKNQPVEPQKINTIPLPSKNQPVELQNTVEIVDAQIEPVTSSSSIPSNSSKTHSVSRSSSASDGFIKNVFQSNNKNNEAAHKVEEPVILHTEEKIDLYKAIFLSSESENEDDSNQSIEPVVKSNQPTEPVINEKLQNFKDALIQDLKKNETSTLNTESKTVTNNTSFITAPVKATGIFSNVNLDQLNKKPAVNIQNKTDVQDPSTYGPRLPNAPTIAPKPLFRNIKKLQIEETNDEWVERSDQPKTDKEKSKKKKSHHHKKHKKSDKKHKKKRKHSDSD